MNNAAEAERARRGRAPGAPRQSGASRGSASRVPLPGGGGVPHTSGAVPRSRCRNKSPGAPRPPRAARGLMPRVAAPALPSRGPAGGRPRSPRLTWDSAPSAAPSGGGRRAPRAGCSGRGALRSWRGGVSPPPPPRSGAGGAAGPPRAARRGCGAERGGRCDSSAIWRPPPPFGFSPLSDVVPAHALSMRGAGGHARRAARSRCPEGRGGVGCEGLPRGTGTAWGARLLAAGNGAPVRGRRGERFPSETAGPSVLVARPSARSGGAGARGPRAAQPSAALPVSWEPVAAAAAAEPPARNPLLSWMRRGWGEAALPLARAGKDNLKKGFSQRGGVGGVVWGFFFPSKAPPGIVPPFRQVCAPGAAGGRVSRQIGWLGAGDATAPRCGGQPRGERWAGAGKGRAVMAHEDRDAFKETAWNAVWVESTDPLHLLRITAVMGVLPFFHHSVVWNSHAGGRDHTFFLYIFLPFLYTVTMGM